MKYERVNDNIMYVMRCSTWLSAQIRLCHFSSSTGHSIVNKEARYLVVFVLNINTWNLIPFAGRWIGDTCHIANPARKCIASRKTARLCYKDQRRKDTNSFEHAVWTTARISVFGCNERLAEQVAIVLYNNTAQRRWMTLNKYRSGQQCKACESVNIIHSFYVYTTVVVIATILCNRSSIAIVEAGGSRSNGRYVK